MRILPVTRPRQLRRDTRLRHRHAADPIAPLRRAPRHTRLPELLDQRAHRRPEHHQPPERHSLRAQYVLVHTPARPGRHDARHRSPRRLVCLWFRSGRLSRRGHCPARRHGDLPGTAVAPAANLGVPGGGVGPLRLLGHKQRGRATIETLERENPISSPSRRTC